MLLGAVIGVFLIALALDKYQPFDELIGTSSGPDPLRPGLYEKYNLDNEQTWSRTLEHARQHAVYARQNAVNLRDRIQNQRNDPNWSRGLSDRERQIRDQRVIDFNDRMNAYYVEARELEEVAAWIEASMEARGSN